MVPLSKVQDLILKHSKLEKELSSQEIDKKLFAEKSKEYSDLNDIIEEANSYYNFQKNKDELEKLINDQDTDKEMREYIEGLNGEYPEGFHASTITRFVAVESKYVPVSEMFAYQRSQEEEEEE